MIVKMIKNLENKMEKMQESVNKDLEELKNKPTNNAITEIRNALEGINGSEVKVSACNAGDPGSILGSGRYPGEGNGNPLLYSYLENSMDGGAWWATVTKSQTQLSDFTHSLTHSLTAGGLRPHAMPARTAAARASSCLHS